jgi:predicted nucleotidyltransferase
MIIRRCCDIVYKIEEIKRRLYPIFQAVPVYKATIFGSYAIGCDDDQSDIDLVIDSHGELHGLRFYGVLEDIVNVLEKNVDMFDASEIGDVDILNDIKNQGVIIYDRTEKIK